MKSNYRLSTFVLFTTLLLAGCVSDVEVGALQTESQSVELGDVESVRVEILFGAGDLKVTSGAEKLMEADFSYNVAKLKPIVEYSSGNLVVRHPETRSFLDFKDLQDFRNEWDLRLNDQVPMNLRVDVGAGTSNLDLSGLSLTGLKVVLGAGDYTIDLSGDWQHDLAVAIDAGAAAIRILVPKEVGVRVDVEAGPHTIEAIGLSRDGGVYTNAAYGKADVTLQIDLTAGIGTIILEEV